MYFRMTYRVTELRLIVGIVGLEWTSATVTQPCRYEKRKEGEPLAEPFISPAQHPIGAVTESFLIGSPMRLW